jgi:hypothetical protein
MLAGRCISRSVAWLSLANVALSVLLIPLVHALTRSLTGSERAASVAAVVCAINPSFVFLSPVLASEHLYVLALFATFLLLAKRRPWAAGVLFGCAVLTRPDALFYAPVAMTLLLSTAAGPRRARLRSAVVFSLCVAAVVTPWVIRNQVSVGPGAGVSTSGGLNFYFGHREGGPGYRALQGTPLDSVREVERQRVGYTLGWQYISSAGLPQLLRDIGVNTRTLFWSTEAASLHWSTREPRGSPDDTTAQPLRALTWLPAVERLGHLVLLALALGSLVSFRQQPAPFLWTAWGIVAMTWLGYAVVFVAMARYRYAAEVVWCLLAGVTLGSFRTAARLRNPPRAADA